MRRIGRSVGLFRICFRVLREHRGLIAFPLVSLLASLIVMAGFIGPVFGLIAPNGNPGPVGYVILACGYVALSCRSPGQRADRRLPDRAIPIRG